MNSCYWNKWQTNVFCMWRHFIFCVLEIVNVQTIKMQTPTSCCLRGAGWTTACTATHTGSHSHTRSHLFKHGVLTNRRSLSLHICIQYVWPVIVYSVRMVCVCFFSLILLLSQLELAHCGDESYERLADRFYMCRNVLGWNGTCLEILSLKKRNTKGHQPGETGFLPKFLFFFPCCFCFSFLLLSVWENVAECAAPNPSSLRGVNYLVCTCAP